MNSKLANVESNLGLWIDEINAQAWAEACHRENVALFGTLAGAPAFAQGIRIEVVPPSKMAARRAFKFNTTLEGEVRFRRLDESVKLSVPMPFHGAFLYRRERAKHPLVTVWQSWLAEAPGFRILRPTSETRRSQTQWRIGLPGGKWVGVPLVPFGDLSAAEEKRLSPKSLAYFGNPDDLPKWLRAPLGMLGPRGTAEKVETPANAWRSIHELILKQGVEGQLSEMTDEDDLDHRMLVTFPVWLKHRILRGCLEAILPRGKNEHEEWRTLARDVLRGEAAGTPELAEAACKSFWDSLKSLGAKIAWAIHDNRSEEKADFVDPVNPLDLVSRITRVRRVHRPSSELKEMPAAFRQNHPSFQGRICPVESPESEQVGLTVHLAAGAQVDFDGKIRKTEAAPQAIGFGAALVPFFAHNDGARNMMGAKNLRQAIPVREAKPPVVRTGGERAIAEFARPLVEAGICPPAGADVGDFYLGQDLLVAYLPWHGLNFEDAIVVGQQVKDAGLLDCVGMKKQARTPIKLGWVPVEPGSKSEFPNVLKGLVAVGTRLVAGSPIAVFAWEGKERSKQRVIRYQERTTAIVKKITFLRKSEWTGGILEYELELPIPIRPGDKLMGRHGNKGVVGAILPADQMPRLPDSPALPEHLRGRPIDVLLNPHGVISRMNIGQLLETHLGWLLHSGRFGAGDIFKSGCSNDVPLAVPFAETVDHDKVPGLLEETGLDRYGRIQLVLPDGGQTLSPVTVGFQHIVRLRHIPELKSQARRGGKDALYSARTGQAIHGRKFGGGQRLGEMEMWALGGHQAEAVLAEMVGIKSSARLASGGLDSALSKRQLGYNGYSEVFRDWLFAMGIDLEISDEEVRMSFLDAMSIVERIGEQNEVTASGSLEARVAASFHCCQGKKHPCQFSVLDDEKIAFRATEGTKEPTLSLTEVLEHLELRPAGPLKKCGTHFELPLSDSATGKPSSTLELTFECVGDQLKAVARFASAVSGENEPSLDQLTNLGAQMSQPEWEKPKSLPEVHLYGRFGKAPSVNWSAEDLLNEFQKEEAGTWDKVSKQWIRWVGNMQVVCPHHKTVKVRGVQPFGEIFQSTPGGLFDPRIFGRQSSVYQSSGRWGYIQLPVEVAYPLHVFLTSSSLEKTQQNAVEKFLEGVGRSTPPKLLRVPVLPARYRLPGRANGKLIHDDLDRRCYAPLLNSCQRYREAETDNQRSKYAQEIANQVEWLFRRLASALREKDGLIRRDGLGRRVDRSARLVITPNPQLQWDQAGVPTTVLLELMGDRLEKWVSERDQEDVQKNPLPLLKAWSWMHPGDNVEAIDDARMVFDAYLKAHPDFVVLLNRQPSLHRDSFQAFHPMPLAAFAGDVIQLCPLTCKGFAADFDGDEMVVHVPLGADAQKEAQRLLPSKNLFSLATEAAGSENVLAHFDQDFVMGTYWLGVEDRVGLRDCFLAALPCDCCRDLTADWNHPRKEQGAALLAHIAENHPSEATDAITSWMRVAFRACSLAGVSFGFYELRKIAEGMRDQVANICDEQSALIPTRRSASSEAGDSKAEPNYNEPLEVAAFVALEKILSSPANNEDGVPGAHFAAMALSGARGKKQVRQIVAARGMLGPGSTGFDVYGAGRRHFFCRHSLVEGLRPDEAFWAAMNARSSMCDKKLGTGYAGGLTRSLVFALWPYGIVAEDCGATELDRNPVHCREQNGFCAKCYGKLPSGELPGIGFPAGLIAAQSIGERGTQLSMQSFHAGTKSIDIHTVRSIFGVGPKAGVREFHFNSPDEAPKFVSRMKGASAYAHLLPRHFQLVWKVLNTVETNSAEAKDLLSAIRQHDPMTRLAFRDPTQLTAEAATKGETCSRLGPFAKVLLGGFAQSTQTELYSENGN